MTALACLLWTAAHAETIDIPLKCHAYNTDQMRGVHVGYGRARLSMRAPRAGLALPELNGAKPIFGTFRLDKTEFIVALASSRRGRGYDGVYLDYDGDGDIAEEKLLHASVVKPVKGAIRVGFPMVNVAYRAGESTMIYTIWPYADFVPGASDFGTMPDITLGRHVTFGFAVACAWGGDFTAGGKNYRIWLWDINGNGRFDDVMSRETSDLMALEEEGELQRLFYTGNLLLLKDRLYGFKVDIGASRAQLVPVEQRLFELKLAHETAALEILSDDGAHCIMAAEAGSAIMAPPGKYRLVSYMQERRHTDGAVWVVSAAGLAPHLRPTGSPAELAGAVTAGGPDRMKFGEPFEPMMKVDFDENRRNAALSPYVLGSGGESLLWLRLKTAGGSLGEKPPEPIYRIATASGEKVAQGPMRYG